MSFDSKLQIFQRMDQMSTELAALRASECRLRDERRSIYSRLMDFLLMFRRNKGSDDVEKELQKLVSDMAARQEDTGEQATPVLISIATPRAPAKTHRARSFDSDASLDDALPLSRSAFRGNSDVDTDSDLARVQLFSGTSKLTSCANSAVCQEPRAIGVPPPPSRQRCWEQDASRCEVCRTAFRPYRRRHHCRVCGVNVCQRCSPFRMMLPNPIRRPAQTQNMPLEIAHRVCQGCYGLVLEGERDGESQFQFGSDHRIILSPRVVEMTRASDKPAISPQLAA